MERKRLNRLSQSGKVIADCIALCPVHFDPLEVYAVMDRDKQKTHFEYHCKKCKVDYKLVPKNE